MSRTSSTALLRLRSTLVLLGLWLPLLVSPAQSVTSARPWVMGYLVGYERDLLPLEELDWRSLSDVVVGRVIPQADGSLSTHFDLDEQEGPRWAASVVRAAHAHGVKAWLMIGGAGTHDAFAEAASDARRTAFVQRLLKLVKQYGADGLDLDWEPIEPGEEKMLHSLALALRRGQPNLRLSVPLPYVNANDPGQEARPALAALAQSVDRLNIMSYDMAGSYQGWSSWHSSALKGESSTTPTSVDSSVRAYLAAGLPAAKLGLGVGFFGLCYQGVSGPRQQAAGIKIKAGDGEMSYRNLSATYIKPGNTRWDAAAAVPYLSSATPLGPQRCTYVSYENPQSIALKGQYARSHGLGGAIIWTLGQGHLGSAPSGQHDPLLRAVRTSF